MKRIEGVRKELRKQAHSMTPLKQTSTNWKAIMIDFFRKVVHEYTMSQQQAPMNGNTGGGAYIPAPRQDMEYICAG